MNQPPDERAARFDERAAKFDERAQRWRERPEIEPCRFGDGQEWHIEDGRHYQEQLRCRVYGEWINPDGTTCRHCRAGLRPGRTGPSTALPFAECVHARPGRPMRRTCAKLSEACGFTCAVERDTCAECAGSGDNGAAQADSESWRRRIRHALEDRLLEGVMPRTQTRVPVDLDAAFGRFVELAGAEAAADLLGRMFRHQAAVPESLGGLAPEALAQQMATLAERHGLARALEDAVYEFESTGRLSGDGAGARGA